MDPVVLSLKSADLRQSDISLFESGHWLNDACINFYFEYLSDFATSEHLFMNPGTSFILLFEDDESDLREAVSELSMDTRQFLFAAVNDNEQPTYGGSHWSLLVLARPSRQIFLYDSLNSQCNLKNAQKIAGKLGRLYREPYSVTRVPLRHPQTNSSDCGVYVLLLAELLASTHAFTLEPLQDRINPESAQQLRTKCLDVVTNLRTTS